MTDELNSIETTAAADLAKAKSFWTRYEVYVVAFVSLVAGLVLGHVF